MLYRKIAVDTCLNWDVKQRCLPSSSPLHLFSWKATTTAIIGDQRWRKKKKRDLKCHWYRTQVPDRWIAALVLQPRSVLLCQHAPNVSGAAATLWLSVKKSFLLFPNAPPGIKKKLLQGCKVTNSKWTKCLLQETITASYLPWPNWQTHWNSWQLSNCLWKLKCTHQFEMSMNKIVISDANYLARLEANHSWNCGLPLYFPTDGHP